MQICQGCGEEVKIVPTYGNMYAICEPNKEVFVTELGHNREGYRLHKCKGKNNESAKQQNSTNQN